MNNIFSGRIVKYSNSLPRKVVESSSLYTSQNLTGHSHGQPAVDVLTGGLDQTTFRDAFQS